jgi:hypothetical protein
MMAARYRPARMKRRRVTFSRNRAHLHGIRRRYELATV